MRAVDALAYLAVFWSASRQQKYTAASASCPNRPIPSAATATGRADFPAWALSNAGRGAARSAPLQGRRVQRTGSRTVHRLARKIRHGRQAAARYQQEDSDRTP